MDREVGVLTTEVIEYLLLQSRWESILGSCDVKTGDTSIAELHHEFGCLPRVIVLAHATKERLHANGVALFLRRFHSFLESDDSLADDIFHRHSLASE